MPTRAKQFRPLQWRPYVRPVFKSDAFYKSAGWRALRAACLQRDGNRCTEAFCSTPNDRLTAHPIIERGTPASTDTLDNFRDGDELILDEEGIDLRDIVAVQREAARALTGLASDSMISFRGSQIHQMAIAVRDETGPVMEVEFSFKIIRRQQAA